MRRSTVASPGVSSRQLSGLNVASETLIPFTNASAVFRPLPMSFARTSRLIGGLSDAGLRKPPTATDGIESSVTFRPTRPTLTDTGAESAQGVLIGLSHLRPNFTQSPVTLTTLRPVRLAGAASVSDALSPAIGPARSTLVLLRAAGAGALEAGGGAGDVDLLELQVRRDCEARLDP